MEDLLVPCPGPSPCLSIDGRGGPPRQRLAQTRLVENRDSHDEKFEGCGAKGLRNKYYSRGHIRKPM